ncbi:SUKH-4 family immunity protein [Deinococcus pimensis]|uniref:SUKH-4 family immunity protein n=1 Tax=Deinococcus pimensis TaxID=309888 RepID=UPI0004AD4D7D|nr:SUKH-4 family immunity protein [Deinococcus pimensis]
MSIITPFAREVVERAYRGRLDRVPEEVLVRVGVDDVTHAFLRDVGLPGEAVGPYEQTTLFRPAWPEPRVIRGLTFVLVASVDDPDPARGRSLWLHLESGLLYSGGEENLVFVNASVAAYLACLTLFREAFLDTVKDGADPWSHLGEDDDEMDGDVDDEDVPLGSPASRARAAHLRELVTRVDPLAFDERLEVDDENFWSFVAHELEWGLIRPGGGSVGPWPPEEDEGSLRLEP